MQHKLPISFYERDDVLRIAKELLGKYLVTRQYGVETSGIIVETEAYIGPEDKASHAVNGRRTQRTEVMFGPPGRAYVYLCYGIHHMFNVVTGEQNLPHAILVRALEPADGIEEMLIRRKMNKVGKRLTSGPGCLSIALGIKTNLSGVNLTGEEIWIEDRGLIPDDKEIHACPRIGIDYSEEYILKPWRFIIRDSPWISVKP